MLDAEMFQKDRAKVLKVDPRTYSRERKRKRKNGRYDAANAGIKATMARGHSKHQGMKVNADAAMKAHVVAELGKKRSPDEIAGRMKLTKMPFYASKNAIYESAMLGAWPAVRPFALHQAFRQEKAEEKDRAAMIPNRKSIGCRLWGGQQDEIRALRGERDVAPKKAENTKAIAVAVERKTRFLLAARMR